MTRYRLKEGVNHYEGGKLVLAGTAVEMSDQRFHSLRDRFELIQEVQQVDPVEEVDPPVTESESEPDDEVEDEGQPEDYSEWLDAIHGYSAKEAKETVGLLDDIDLLAYLLVNEKRTTVATAIENRIEGIS